MTALPLVLALQAVLETGNPATQTIPSIFHGVWAPARLGCAEKNRPEFVEIAGRRVDFYESHGFLQLAQLNHASDPPSFHGRFSYAGELRFWDEAIKLELRGANLFVTHRALSSDDEVEDSEEALVRCPAARLTL